MLLDLAQREHKKYTWITQLSLLFTFHNGYLVHDTGDEIEIILNGVYNHQVHFLIRNHQFDDADALYAALVHNKYDFLLDVITYLPDLQIATIVNMKAGIGISTVCLAKFFNNVTIQAYETDSISYEQFRKNISLNEFETNIVKMHHQYDIMMHEVKNVDLLICPSESINQLISSGNLLNLITIARIIVIETFSSNEDQSTFFEYITSLNLANKYFGQTLVCWKP